VQTHLIHMSNDKNRLAPDAIPSVDDPRTLRNVYIKGTDLRLHTWDANKRFSTGQETIGYALYEGETLIFAAEDCGVSPMHAIDSDRALCGLLTFLSLKIGDTDRDYFDAYAPDQLDFSQRRGEEISMYILDCEESGIEIFADLSDL
jgi:hypothetical protein